MPTRLRLSCRALLIVVLVRPRAALTGKHDTLVRRAHQMLNAALVRPNVYSAGSQASHQLNQALEQAEQSD